MWYGLGIGLTAGVVLDYLADWLPMARYALPPSKVGTLRRVALAVLCACMSASLAEQYGLGWGAMVRLLYCGLLLLIAVIDLEHGLVPNILVGAGMVLALGFHLLTPVPGLKAALGGAALAGGMFVLISLARRDALGFGDVKLAFLIGMITGFPGVLQAVTLGIVSGGLGAAVLLLSRMRKRKQYMPYAPYLVAGCLATLLYGQQIAAWYADFVRAGV